MEKYSFCSGSIIDRNFVITAGLCCIDEPPSRILAGLNDLANSEDGAQKIAVDRVVPHPNYAVEKHTNDISVLHSKEPLTLGNETRTAIIKLPWAGYVASGNANVSGWGFNLNDSSSKLMSARVPIISDDEW